MAVPSSYCHNHEQRHFPWTQNNITTIIIIMIGDAIRDQFFRTLFKRTAELVGEASLTIVVASVIKSVGRVGSSLQVCLFIKFALPPLILWHLECPLIPKTSPACCERWPARPTERACSVGSQSAGLHHHYHQSWSIIDHFEDDRDRKM